MKKIFFLLLLIVLPTLVFEGILQSNAGLFEKILLINSDFLEWSAAASKMNVWPDTIIMGTSLAKEGIDPRIIQSQLSKKGIHSTVGSIAINADSTSTDYLTLKRILKTCTRCPKTIIYQITDVSLRDHETKIWKDFTYEKILKLYYPDPQTDALLATAANDDSYFRGYLASLRMLKSFRTYFTKGRIVDMLLNENSYEPLYSDTNWYNGFYSYNKTLTKKNEKESIDQYREYLENYHTGGVTLLFLQNFLSLAKKNNIKVYIIIMPVTQIYLDTFARDEKLYRKEVFSVQKNYNLPLIDDMYYNTKDYLLYTNTNHLNKKGAKLFSNYLGIQLANVWH